MCALVPTLFINQHNLSLDVNVDGVEFYNLLRPSFVDKPHDMPCALLDVHYYKAFISNQMNRSETHNDFVKIMI